MVTLCFKLSDRDDYHLPLSEPLSLKKLLNRIFEDSDMEVGRVIAVRQGKVVAYHHTVEDHDIIEIYPAISGG